MIAFSEEDLRLAEIAGRMGTKEVVGGNPQVHLGFLARKKNPHHKSGSHMFSGEIQKSSSLADLTFRTQVQRLI